MKPNLGRKSKLNLCDNLDYRLVHIVCVVAQRNDCPCDFGVFETKRTIETQKQYLKRGTTTTMNSNHIPNKLGIVNAVDIVPYVDGKYQWDLKYLKPLISIFENVANELYPKEIKFGKDFKVYKNIKQKDGTVKKELVPFEDYPHIEIQKEYQII